MTSPPRPGMPREVSIPQVLATFLFTCAVLAQAVIAWKFWAITWDDSAITLGFARTFALTGSIEPTPHSGVVEGYSTTLWMLLMAAVAKLVASPSTLLIVAKLATLALNILNLFFLKTWLGTWMPKPVGTIAAAIFGCCFMYYETINGMETPLLLAFILSLLLLRRGASASARAAYLAAGVALLLVRWEAAWYLLPFLILERPLRRAFVSATTWFVAFAAMNVVRRLYFGSFLPNTIIAKHGPPYLMVATLRDQIAQHLGQLHLMLSGCWGFALIAVLFAVYLALTRKRTPRIPNSWELRFTLLFVLFSGVLTVAIGKNWGPDLRSFYSGWPFLLALLLLPLAQAFQRTDTTRSLSVAFAALCIFSLHRIDTAVKQMRAPDAPLYMQNASVGKIKQVNDAIEAVQQATGQHQVLFAGPDMGAILLYSHGVRIIDLGLLCDKTLARERFGAVETYVLQERRPDIIEVHGMWTDLTHLLTSARFHQDYSPVIVDGRRLFLRNQLIAAIPADRLKQFTFSNANGADSFTPQSEQVDKDLSASFGTYRVLF